MPRRSGHGAPGAAGRPRHLALDGHARIHALAGDTDGVDGQEGTTGAIFTPDSLARAWQKGLRPKPYPERDTYTYLGFHERTRHLAEVLRRDAEPSQPLARFIERVEALGPELPGR